MNNYRYQLEKGSRLHRCPQCNRKSAKRYIDTITGEHLPDEYCRCNHEAKCGYHLNPYKTGYHRNNTEPYEYIPQPTEKPPRPPAYIPPEVLHQTLTGYEDNSFIQYLLQRYPAKAVENIIAKYYIGTIPDGYRAGAITFPFINERMDVCAIQVKQFDESNHTTGTGFYHSMIEAAHKIKGEPLPDWLTQYLQNDKKINCLFGAHLLSKNIGKPVGLVEAPKTAIYGALHFPEMLWLAVYNISSLSFDKVEPLQGRHIVLFPDTSRNGKAFDLWSAKAKDFNERLPGTRFIVSDLLEQYATDEEKEKGIDLADILVRYTPHYENHEKYEAEKTTFIFSEQQPELIELPTPSTPEFIKICLQIKDGTPIHEAAAGWNIGSGGMYQLEYLAALRKFTTFEKNKYLQN
jgi:hypothetical protein